MTTDASLAAAAHAHAIAASPRREKTALVEQVETAEHLFNGGFDGVVPVSKAFEHAWLGLGVAQALDGEILVVDGVVWRVPATGIPEVADPDLMVPFAVSEGRVASEAIEAMDVPTGTQFEELGALIATEESHCVTVRLEGSFTNVVLRSERRQTPPYRPLEEVLAAGSDEEVRFSFPNWEGVLVGYRFPDARGGTFVPGLHLHGLAQDHTSGGHVRAMTVQSARLTWARARSHVTLPTEHFHALMGAPDEHHAHIREALRNGDSHADIAGRRGLQLSL